ncbi:YgjV family protein [Ketobacter sp. MCCC 1A13808]|uniref:YgjV family protein n=1 Tax=Ketobacter sp. MCCC 1A13808 TaxID=2602738 RepID=UPI0012EB83A8|nr:YgjV family protein [Ketobacter sp. MCCC 1A13808]MVF14928.1 YgjV family protein [Ketobacter sp. MCCC 1A13808]
MELATVFGVLGVIANVSWPLIKSRKHMLFGQILACIFMLIHFWLLDAQAAAAVMATAGLQAALAIPLETHPKFKSIYLVSLLLTPIVSWLTWHGAPSIFSTFALIFFCIGNLQVSTTRLRVLLLCCLLCWVGHNLIISSYPALVSNLLALCTSVYGISRELMLKKLSQREEEFAR